MGFHSERGSKSTMTHRRPDDNNLEIMTTQSSNGFNKSRGRGFSIGNLHSGA